MIVQFVFGKTFKYLLLLLLTAIVLLQQNVEAQANQVSSKLDFDETENKTNSDMPIVLGMGQSGSLDANQKRNDEEGGSERDTKTATGVANIDNKKSGPKIHGVRVTVDTGDAEKSKENTESIEITDVGKHKKRVGIHTDITFEISTDGDSRPNVTSSGQGDEDASVPIYKGRSGPTQKTHKPYDTKSHWNPNLSSERRSYENRGHSTGPAYYYPQYYPTNVPVYVSTGDGRNGGSSTGYRRGDGWNSYVPSSNVWTTERSQNEQHHSGTMTAQGALNWKPCYCMTSVVDNRKRRANNHVIVARPVHHTGPIINVDGKLEKPFAKR